MYELHRMCNRSENEVFELLNELLLYLTFQVLSAHITDKYIVKSSIFKKHYY